ncbi:MAG: glycosyltransferase family 4 protein [Patescibacteria group bacterium]|nr:glycosyltransferase family 4 protein [Patescibacteria group bacterium]
MKIAFLAAANSIHGIRWVKYFRDKGHEVTWVSLAPPISEAIKLVKSVRFYEVKPSPLSDINGSLAIRHLLLAVKQLKKILKEVKPNLLHVHSAGTYGLVGTLSNFHPAVLTPWGSDILLSKGFKRSLVSYVVRSANAYTCDGENTFQKLIELGADKNKIRFIRFGTDVEKFRPLKNRKSKTYKVISLRSLVPVYDIETLIRAAKIVVQKFPSIELTLAGDGPEKEKLKDLTKELNIEKSVKFLGKVDNEELPTLLQSADIYVSTALSDSGLSASTAEAMASGLPVIVTDTGDNKDWVQNEFVIPVKNPEALSEKIFKILKNRNLAEQLGKENRKIIEEKNNYYIEMEKVELLYEKIIKSR